MSHSSNGIPPEVTSPILTTNVDEFTLEEMSHLAAFADVGARVPPPNPKGNKGSEDDPSLLLQDDAVQNVDWVIEGVEDGWVDEDQQIQQLGNWLQNGHVEDQHTGPPNHE